MWRAAIGSCNTFQPKGKGNFPRKSFFYGITGSKLLYCYPVVACNFHVYAAHRRSLLQQRAAGDAARVAVNESSDTVRSRNTQCQAPPNNPETEYTYHSRG